VEPDLPLGAVRLEIRCGIADLQRHSGLPFLQNV
jgi:hypothetical protein